jgi:hypothetical protein
MSRDSTRMMRATGGVHSFDHDELRKKIIPEHTKRILALQKSRKELQKLPKFPDADLIRAINEQEECSRVISRVVRGGLSRIALMRS